MATNVTLKRVNNTSGSTDDLHPTTDWAQVESKPSTFTPTSHSHGNITNGGAITASATIATGDHLVIADNSASNALTTSSITFDTSATTQFLRRDGVWTSVDAGNQFVNITGDTMTGNLINQGYIEVEDPNDSDYVRYRHYGVEFNRSASYLRPETNGTYTLNIGSNDQNKPWDTIKLDADNKTIIPIGNVGIGTTSPIHKLEVGDLVSTSTLGTVGIKTDSSNYGIFIEETGAGAESWGIGVDSDGDLNFYDSGSSTPSVVFNDGGNVGIGTSNPLQKLQVNGDITVDRNATGRGATITLANGSEVAGNYSALMFGNVNAHNSYRKGAIAYRTDGAGYGRGDIYFLQRTDANSGNADLTHHAMVIKNNGNVGIGTTSPSEKLQVDGNIKLNSTLPKIQFVDTDHNSDFEIRNNNGNLDVYDTTNARYITTFHSNGNVYNTGQTISYGNITISNGLPKLVLDDSNSDSDFHIANNNGVFEIADTTNQEERFAILSNGKVGIGTTSPTGKLEVVGDSGLYIKATTNNASDGAWIRFSDSSGSSYAQYGFIKYKHANNTVETEPVGSEDGFIIGGSENSTVVSIQGSLNVENQTNFENQVEIDSGDLLVRNGDLDVNGQAKIGSGLSSDRSTYGLTAGFTSNSTFSSNADVSDSNRTLSLVNESTTTNTYSTLSFRNSPSSGTSMADFKYVHRGTNSGDLIYTNNNGGTWTDQFSILSNGNVGIGTTSPSYKLDVNGSAHANSMLLDSNLYLNYDNSPAGVDSYIYFGDDASDTAHYLTFDNSAQFFTFSNHIYALGNIYADSHLYAKGELRLNYDNSGDAIIRFGDAASDTAHYMQFSNTSQQFILSNRVVGTAGRLGAIEYNGSDVDKVNFALSGSTLTITTS